VVAIWAALVFAGLAVAFGHPLVNGLTHLSQRLPSYVQDAENGHGWIGHLARRYHLADWAARNAPKLQSIGASLAKPALNLGKGAVSLVVTLGTITVLVLLLLLEGPKMRQGILGLMAPERARRYARVAHEINQSVTGYMVGDILTSVIAGVVVFFTLLALGIPFPLLWALWVALVDFLPQVGGALAGIPTVLFALGRSLTAGIVTAAVFIAYQQVENHVLNPVIMSRTVKVNPLLILVSVLVGASIGDWVGGFFGSFVAALLAIPTAGALQIVAKDLRRATGPGGPSTTNQRAPATNQHPRPATSAAPRRTGGGAFITKRQVPDAPATLWVPWCQARRAAGTRRVAFVDGDHLTGLPDRSVAARVAGQRDRAASRLPGHPHPCQPHVPWGQLPAA
jgi:predicted PurR-regulated permease PerM